MSNLPAIHKAIPTTYAHTRFRSRLEARWAAWFDLAGWQWDYEPMDVDGWSPDFMIRGRSPILVEVKPAAWIDGPRLSLDAFAKATKATGVDILLLGLGPIVKDGFGYIGMCSDGDAGGFSAAVCQETYLPAAHFGYCSDTQGFNDRLSGYYEGGSWDGRGHTLVEPNWRRAGSLTQWSPK